VTEPVLYPTRTRAPFGGARKKKKRKKKTKKMTMKQEDGAAVGLVEQPRDREAELEEEREEL
jgi:hypothetical protein